MEYSGQKYKIQYDVILFADRKEEKISLLKEKIIYWRRGKTWKTERDLEFCNPYYDTDSILNDVAVKFQSTLPQDE